MIFCFYRQHKEILGGEGMRKRETDPEKLKERYYKQLARQNEYAKKTYYHISVNLPMEYKEKTAEKIQKAGCKNISEYIRRLIDSDMSK